MARMKVIALMGLSLLALAGCSAFFGFNAFSSLQTPPALDASKYEGSGGLAALQTDLSSPTVVAQLIADPTTAQAIEKYLHDNYLNSSGGITTPDQQQAATLYCNLQLQTTQGAALVNNVVSVLLGGTTTTSGIQDLLKSLLPPAAFASQQVFSDMIDALCASSTVYAGVGAGIVDVNGNGKIDPGEGVVPGTNMGDIGQKAMVAYTIAVVWNQMTSVAPGQEDSQLFLLATDPTSASGAAQSLAMPDPQNPTSVNNAASTATYETTNLAGIQRLLDCAGLKLPASL